MADELISRQAVLDILKFKPIDDGGVVDDCIMQVLALAKSKVNKLPAVDAVSREVLEQIKWERDIAMEQLEAHGISFGAKTLDCDGCIYANRKRPQKCSCCRRNRYLKDCYEEG